ncbi:MAG: polysaccharide biosynthesis/export family protein [Planctomycetes bacterium]|nr:polysaccharide biosynthesis/export family protein [Planctomycetota bacterium]
MMGMSQRQGVVSIVLLGLCTALTGCLNTGTGEPTFRGINEPGASPQTVTFPNRMPPGPMAQGGGGQVRKTVYMQPNGGREEVFVEPGMVMHEGMMVAQHMPLPGELKMTSHPPHRVAPPDILLIEALRLIPKGPYKLEPMEVLQIEVSDTLPKQEIKGLYMISPEGTVNLGHTYGAVRVGGLTIDQTQAAIKAYLNPILKGANVNVILVQMRSMQNVRGEHLVRPDGTIHLGMYGSVYVSGMTLGQVKCVVEKHLSVYMVDPQVSVDVKAYNSRKIYVIADGAGLGQHVIALPATGNETVLDVISRLQGGAKQIPEWSSTRKIWVARPSPAGHPCSQVLPVDWHAIVKAGRTETNYQLLPGDRIYIEGDPYITAYNLIDKFLAPIERVINFVLLSSTTYQSLRGNNNGLLLAR